MSWTINGQVPAEMGIKQLKLRHQNLADGAFSFVAEGRNVDAAHLFDHLQTVTVKSGSDIRWTGPVVTRPVFGRPGAEGHTYQVASPWWWLEHTLYTQEWAIGDGAVTVPTGRVILGLEGLSGRLTIGQMVAKVLDYAQSVGCPVQAGDINIGVQFPIEEVKGLMCSEVIRRVLRWAPDAVGWWTYGPVSTFHLKRRSALIAKGLQVGTRPLETIDIARRDDLVPRAVELVYERTDTLDGTPKFSVVKDTAPTGGLGVKQPLAVQYTIPLAGGAVTTLRQKVTVRTIQGANNPGGNPTGDKDVQAYWGRILGLVGKAKTRNDDAKVPAITFFPLSEDGPYFQRELANPYSADGSGPYELEDPQDPDSSKVRLNAALPRELVGGAVASWMSGVRAQRQLIRMKISYTPEGKSQSITPTIVSAHMVATDATNRTYSKVDSVLLPEEPAPGLAQQVLTALSVVQYEGAVSLLEQECSGSIGLGNVLDIVGGRLEWGGMKAVVQTVDEDLDNGRTVLQLGPPNHLGPQDMIELQRCDRRPEGNTGNRGGNAGTRSTGDL